MTVTVEFFFDLGGIDTTGLFLLDSSLLDGADVLGGDLATDVTPDVYSVSCRRGRARSTDEYAPGSVSVQLDNTTRTYDPLYTAGPYAGNIVPGKRVRVTRGAAAIFDGFVDDWAVEYVRNLSSTATATGSDALALLAQREMAAHTATAQASGARVNAVLNRADVAYPAARSVDTGAATLQADTVTEGTNVLEYLRLVARTEQGFLYVASDGVLRFADRSAQFSQANEVTFTDEAGSVTMFDTVAVESGSRFLYNRVTVNRVGGTAQTEEDTTTQATFGVRTLSSGYDALLYDSDSQSADLAGWLLNRYKNPENRISQIRVDLSTMTDDDIAAVLALDLTDVVGVRFQPPGGGDPIEQTSYVEGIAHEVSGLTHTVTFDLGDASLSQALILDDATFGVLDSNILGF